MSRVDVLVDADWLSQRIDDPTVVIIEVDEDASAYDGGHIRNAIKFDWRQDLQDPIRRDLVGPDDFAALLSKSGVNSDSTVVLYGGNNNWFAAYAYWYFKLYGHRDVRLLDGGRKKWELDERELVMEVPTRPASQYPVPVENTDIRAKRDDVLAALNVQQLVDVRSPDEYAGRLLAPAHLPQEQSQRPGHIPTAQNVPWAKSANDDGTFKSDEELVALYQGAGLQAGGATIAYCRIGERSAHTWFVLHELLDWPKVRNYDGSWTEWGSLVGVPVVVGDEPGQV